MRPIELMPLWQDEQYSILLSISYFVSVYNRYHLNVEYKIRNENIAPLDGAVLVKAIAGGPFYITGSVSIGDENLAIWEGDQVKLCRCGYSQMKPFCDGAHKNKHPAGGG